jgi:hypothetical protein
MWTGEIREWYILQGTMTGRIYNSKNCRWVNWEYPDGAYISIDIYHMQCDNYMRLTMGKEWHWDVRQVGDWNPCPLHFMLLIHDYKRPFNYRSWNYHVTKPDDNAFRTYNPSRFILKSGCMVS